MPPTRILVPTDFSPLSERATQYAVDLAQRCGGHVDLLYVWQPLLSDVPELPTPMTEQLADEAEANAERSMVRAIARHRCGGITLEGAVASGAPAQAVASAAARLGTDLIVTATHGRRGLARLLHGSVAEEIVRSAPCPVLVVH